MKRFLIPEDLWDTGLLEQWLEEQAPGLDAGVLRRPLGKV